MLALLKVFSQVIQSCLADRTVLTIAHRVDTVLGCDRFYIASLLLFCLIFGLLQGSCDGGWMHCGILPPEHPAAGQ